MKLQTQIPNKWPIGRKFFLRFEAVFVMLAVISIPFKRYVLADVGKYLQFIFEPLVRFSAKHIFHLQYSYTSNITSDATGMYIHFFNIIVIAFAIALVWLLIDTKRKIGVNINSWLMIVSAYYLALQLSVYACSKLFQWQFYIPEPNTLFTTVGNTPRDLLFWSAMGVSSLYSIFSGVIEILPALLLLFKKTRTIGACVASLVLLNVVMLNFGFDISVKIYSLFLLMLAVIVATPALHFLYYPFRNKQGVVLNVASEIPKKIIPISLYAPIKTIVIAAIVLEVLYPYVSTKNFNDKLFAKPALFGAYEVDSFYKNNRLLPPLITDTIRWRRIFVHSKGYFITQYMNDAMQDYNMETDTLTNRFAIEHTQTKTVAGFSYQQINDSVFVFNGLMNTDSIKIVLKKINISQLPALQNEFHWTVDE